MLMEIGVCLTVAHGPLFVWAHIDIIEITFVHIGNNEHFSQASGELTKEECEKHILIFGKL